MQTGHEWQLQRDQVCRLTPGARLTVAQGTVWLTGLAHQGDVFAQAGTRISVPLRGRVIAEAIRGPALLRTDAGDDTQYVDRPHTSSGALPSVWRSASRTLAALTGILKVMAWANFCPARR